MNEYENQYGPRLPRLQASWPAPDPSTRFAVGDHDLRPARPGRPPRRRRALAAVVVAAALLAGVAGYAATNQSSSPSVSSALVPSTVPTSPGNGSTGGATPGTGSPGIGSPGTGSPGTGSSGTTPATDPSSGVGVSSASTTALSVGVVDIDTNLAYQGAAAAGTGIVLTSDGEILTNNHVVDGATSITVTIVSTGKSYSGTVVGTSPTADVAVVQLKGASGLEVAKLGDSSTLKVGDAVTAVGNAGGVGGAPTVGSGQVIDLDQQITASDAGGGNAEQLTGLIEINAALQPGESGGPLYNAAGQVVGMDTAGTGSGARRSRVPSTDNYAIPVNTALAVVKQIESGKASDTITIGTPGFLGVEVDGSDAAAATAGATVSDIVSGTPADHLGLKAGDVITAVDGTAIQTSDALGKALKVHHGGDKVSLTWTDTGGQTHTASVTLIAGPAN